MSTNRERLVTTNIVIPSTIRGLKPFFGITSKSDLACDAPPGARSPQRRQQPSPTHNRFLSSTYKGWFNGAPRRSLLWRGSLPRSVDLAPSWVGAMPPSRTFEGLRDLGRRRASAGLLGRFARV